MRRVLAAAIAATGVCAFDPALGQVISIAATVTSGGSCAFRPPPGPPPSTINIPTIDPSGSTTATGTAVVVIRCTGGGTSPAVIAWTNNNGLHGTSPSNLRMQRSGGPGQYLPYSLSYSLPSGSSVAKTVSHTLTVTASVTQSAYQDAYEGSYSDTVTITLSP